MKIGSVLIFGVLLAGSLFAQDPPSRVARLNWLIGNVSFQPSGVDDWAAATLNYPLTTGDQLYADAGARAEIHVGPNAIRLNGESAFGFLNVDDRTVQARFTQGAMEIRLRLLEDDDIYEIDTPQGAVSLLRTGDYRVDADPGRNAVMVTAWSGEAEVLANGRSYIVHARQTGYFAEGAEGDIRSANPVDDFDHFTADRNLRDDRVPNPVHVSQTMAGYEDLDEYGTWSETPDYGWIWAPRVNAGWAPYHQGRWAWVEPWGWTWIDEAPWGFAPFHYGRWAYWRSGWVWVPGAVTHRPVYAPALVVFVGGPRLGGGTVAWFPLGPREPYYPAYHVSSNYVRQVNITHVTNINVTNNVNVRYVNQQAPGAITAIPERGFAGSRTVRDAGRGFPSQSTAQSAAQGAVIGTSPGVVPLRESVMGGQGGGRQPRALVARQVVAKSAPPAPAVSFEARQQMLRQNAGRPLAPEQVAQIRQQQPAAVVNRAPVRISPAASPAAPSRPVPVDRPAGRIEDVRPGNVRPMTPGVLSGRPDATRPDVGRPAPERVEPAPRPAERPAERRPEFRPEVRPAPQPVRPETPMARPAAPFQRPVERPLERPVERPQPSVRPQPEVRREAPPVREPRPEPRKEEKKDEKK